jgi:hypothetical protein
MVLSAKHIPIRRLVARLLGNNEFRGILHSCGAVAGICNVVLPGPDLVSEDLVMASFVGEGENSWKHIEPIELGMDDTDPFILSCCKIRTEDAYGYRSTNVVMGLFNSEAVAPSALDYLNVTTNIITSRLHHLNIETPPPPLIESVQKLIRDHEKRRKTRNKTPKAAKRKSDQLDTDSQPLPPRPEDQRPTQQRPEVKQPPSIPIEMQLAQQTDLLKDLLRQQRDLEAQIATERARYIELKQASCAAQSDIDDYLLAYNNALVEQDCKTLLVVADGKPGMLRLAPGDDLILYEDIEQSLISRYGPEPALIKCNKHRSIYTRPCTSCSSSAPMNPTMTASFFMTL